MRASPQALYKSFTTGWEGWFALEGALIVDPVVNGGLFFVVEHEGERDPHYGRFLALEPSRKVELTWLTGKDGTQGAETVLSVDLEPRAGGCALTLTHRGFYDQERADHHGKSWERIASGTRQAAHELRDADREVTRVQSAAVAAGWKPWKVPMKPHISVLTLGVADLEKSLVFYRDGLGLLSAKSSAAGSNTAPLPSSSSREG